MNLRTLRKYVLRRAVIAITFACPAHSQGPAAVPPEEQIRSSVVRVNSVMTGTGFAVLTEGRRLYLLTAAHVVGGRQPTPPPCSIDFGNPDQALRCEVILQFDDIDLAVISADAAAYPRRLGTVRLGNSWHLMDNGAVFTYGYPQGGSLRRFDGRISGADRARILVQGIIPDQGQSGSPLFDASDGSVIGIILTRSRDGEDEGALEIDQVKLFLRREMLFRAFVEFQRPPADATGPLVEADQGPSLKNAFANAASPERWYERAKRYKRTDREVPVLGDNGDWLGVERTYLSSQYDKLGIFGRGWVHSLDYRIDIDKSSLCKLYLWDAQGTRMSLETLTLCEDVKRSLSPQVDDASELDGPLRANMDETDLLVVITEQGENRNPCEEQRNIYGFSSFSPGFARRCAT
jgi:hypothetical protein